MVNTAVMTAVALTYAPAGRCLTATTTLGAEGSAQAEEAARRHAGLIYGVDTSGWELLTTHVIKEALPAQAPPLQVRQPVALSERLFVAGDHRDTASIQALWCQDAGLPPRCSRSSPDPAASLLSPEPFDELRTALVEGRSSTLRAKVA